MGIHAIERPEYAVMARMKDSIFNDRDPNAGPGLWRTSNDKWTPDETNLST